MTASLPCLLLVARSGHGAFPLSTRGGGRRQLAGPRRLARRTHDPYPPVSGETFTGSAARSAGGQPAVAELFAIASAFRGWALAQPHLFRLLYAAPVPGYDANASQLVEAAGRSMAVLVPALARITAGRPVRRRWSRCQG
ncbi:MAG: TetR-like C-terminal domain-containing protein [Actinomycetota bacterium]